MSELVFKRDGTVVLRTEIWPGRFEETLAKDIADKHSALKMAEKWMSQ